MDTHGLTDYAATVVFICMIVAAVRRIVFKPARYAVPRDTARGTRLMPFSA